MSRIFSSKKRALVGVIAALAITTAAMAYWTTGGSGDGEAGVASEATGAIELTGTIDDAAFRPGHTSDITISAENTDPETDLRVQSTTLDTITTSDPDCDPAWFESSSDPVTQDQTVEAGQTEDLGATHSITFNNADANQDACKSATVSFVLTSD